MADYKRLVSYIYAYPGGVRDKNVGFAKAEVRNGQFKLTVSVKGVYTDTPELFGVYVMVDGKKHQPGGFTLLKTGTVMVNQGIGQYQDLFNPMNINQSGYTFEDISGIALARENEDFYRMFSLWEDCILNTGHYICTAGSSGGFKSGGTGRFRGSVCERTGKPDNRAGGGEKIRGNVRECA